MSETWGSANVRAGGAYRVSVVYLLPFCCFHPGLFFYEKRVWLGCGDVLPEGFALVLGRGPRRITSPRPLLRLLPQQVGSHTTHSIILDDKCWVHTSGIYFSAFFSPRDQGEIWPLGSLLQ